MASDNDTINSASFPLVLYISPCYERIKSLFSWCSHLSLSLFILLFICFPYFFYMYEVSYYYNSILPFSPALIIISFILFSLPATPFSTSPAVIPSFLCNASFPRSFPLPFHASHVFSFFFFAPSANLLSFFPFFHFSPVPLLLFHPFFPPT